MTGYKGLKAQAREWRKAIDELNDAAKECLRIHGPHTTQDEERRQWNAVHERLAKAVDKFEAMRREAGDLDDD